MKKKVLFLLASNKYSGAENVVCTIISNLGTEYDCVYCSPNGAIKDTLKEKGIKFLPLEKMSFSCVKKAINDFKPDIIHANDYIATYIASLFNKKVKVISHIHGNKESMNVFSIKSFTFNIVTKRLNHIIWVSDSTYNDYYYKDTVTNKSTILKNVINKQDILDKANSYESDDNWDLIYLGRLQIPKNPEKTIEIVKKTKELKKDIKVAMVGDGDKKPIIEDMINKYDLKDNVKLFGFLSNPYPILNNSKLLIMSSDREGTPMVALEAQMMGKPIISTPVDGLKTIITNDINGYLSDDIDVLKDKIIEYLNPSMLNKLSKNSSNWFDLNNNLNDYIKQIIDIYNK